VVVVEAMQRNRCRENELPEAEFSQPSAHDFDYRAKMELTLGSLVNEWLAGWRRVPPATREDRRLTMEPAGRAHKKIGRPEGWRSDERWQGLRSYGLRGASAPVTA
jgi:hypothetical protein